MSLVAYGSSDDSDDEDQDCFPSNDASSKPNATQTKDNKTESISAQAQSTNQANVDKVVFTEDHIENNISKEKELFSSIPAPKNKIPVQVNEKLDELPSKKTTVKITVPSLSEFKDDEREPSKKKLKPSAKGSGLFALLPAPKNVFLKETKSADGSKTQAPLVPRSVSKPPPVIPKRFLKPTEEEVATEDNQNSLDFFSLGSLNDDPDEVSGDPMEELSGLAGLPRPRSWTLPEPETSSPAFAPSEVPSSSNIQDNQDNDDFIPIDNGNIQLSEEALQILCGRRATKQQQEVEVIDVSGAELLPDPNEWLTKQLTEERQLPSRGFGKRHDGPTSQQRRKHQITYLAYQAKENELELKNQWSQNRMTRKQTQSKYGF